MNLLEEFLTEIADAIRKRKAKSGLIEAQQFAEEIESIPQEITGNFQEKSVNVTSNSATTVTPDTGYNGLSKVTITPKTQTKTVNITTSAAIDIIPDSGNVGLSKVTVTPILQTKSQTITSNGTVTLTPDSGNAGLSSVAITTNISPSNLISNSKFNSNLAKDTEQSWTIPATAKYAIITLIQSHDYTGASAVSGTPTCTATAGTLAKKIGTYYESDNQRTHTYVWTLTNTTGKASTVKLKASYGGGANYGHRHAFASVVY